MKLKIKLHSLPFVLLFPFLVLVLSIVPVLAIWTDRNLDFWISYFKGHPVNVPYWLSLLVTIFGNSVIVGVNILGEICRLFV